MDEITLINLLNRICEKSSHLSWQINCKYTNVPEETLMEVGFSDKTLNKKVGNILFHLDTGKVLEGFYRSMVPAEAGVSLTDVLLEILYFENTKKLQASFN